MRCNFCLTRLNTRTSFILWIKPKQRGQHEYAKTKGRWCRRLEACWLHHPTTIHPSTHTRGHHPTTQPPINPYTYGCIHPLDTQAEVLGRTTTSCLSVKTASLSRLRMELPLPESRFQMPDYPERCTGKNMHLENTLERWNLKKMRSKVCFNNLNMSYRGAPGFVI